MIEKNPKEKNDKILVSSSTQTLDDLENSPQKGWKRKFEKKMVIETEYSHQKAEEFLKKIEFSIMEKEDKNFDETLFGLYKGVDKFTRRILGAPNYNEGFFGTIEEIIKIFKKKHNDLHLKFTLIKFLEEVYVDDGEFLPNYSKEKHEAMFQEGLNYAYNRSDEEIRDILESIYSDYC